jgi:hypothetical protein
MRVQKYARPVAAPPARKGAPAPAAGRPQPHRAGPQRSALWHAIQLKAARAASIPAGNASGLPVPLQAGVERLSGIAMDDVRVHRNSPEPAKLGALAYAQGSEIHLGPGQERHLPHEVWHVVQQKQGRVLATTQAKGVAINDEHGLEREADAMASRMARPIADDGLKEARAALPSAHLPVTQLVAVTDNAFMTSLGLSAPEIEAVNALDMGSVEANLYQGIIRESLTDSGVTEARLEALKQRLAASTAITQTQELGLRKVANVIIREHPLNAWRYIGIGRSPAIILEFLKQAHHATTYELPMGGLTNVDAAGLLLDQAKTKQLKAIVEEYVNPLAGKRYLIIDYSESGNSIAKAKTILAQLYPLSIFESLAVSVNEALPGAQADADPQTAAVTAFALRLRMEIGKASLPSFKSLDLTQDVSEWIPELNEGGSEKRRALVAGII